MAFGPNQASNLASEGLDIVEHVNWIREVLLVPNHVLVVLGILDIQPEDVNRHIFFVEPPLHAPDIVGTDIVPPALVIAQRPMRGKLDRSGQFRILAENPVWCGSRKEEDVEDTGLGNPMGLSRLLSRVSDVDPCFGSGGDKNSNGGICRVRVDQGDGSVERRGGGSDVFEDIAVIESVWIAEERIFASCGWKVQTGSMLWDTIGVTVIGEVDIQRKRLGTYIIVSGATRWTE